MDDGNPLAIVSFQLVEVQLNTNHLTPEEKKDIWISREANPRKLATQANALSNAL